MEGQLGSLVWGPFAGIEVFTVWVLAETFRIHLNTRGLGFRV